MNEIPNEMLMAYADGELANVDRIRVESYLAQSSEARLQLDVYVATGKRLANLFDQPIREPVPQRLIDAVVGVRPVNGDVVSLDAFRRKRGASALPQWAMLAACVATVAIGAGTYVFSHWSTDDQNFALTRSGAGVRVAAAELALALDGTTSGKVLTRDIDGVSTAIRPVFTFATAAHEYCRQYVVAPIKGDSFAGVACREGSGAWRIETHVPFAPERGSGGQIVPAGKAELAPVETTVDRLISGDVLSGGDEMELMKSGWAPISK